MMGQNIVLTPSQRKSEINNKKKEHNAPDRTRSAAAARSPSMIHSSSILLVQPGKNDLFGHGIPHQTESRLGKICLAELLVQTNPYVLQERSCHPSEFRGRKT